MKKAPRQTLTAPIRRIRFAYVALFFCFWTVLIAGRLAWLQVVRHSDFVHRAAMQQQRTFEVAPRRGMMYDRNLRELAVTVQVDSVFAVPSELGENRASAAEILAEIVHCRSAGQLYFEAADDGAIQCFEGVCVGRSDGSIRRRRSACAN